MFNWEKEQRQKQLQKEMASRIHLEKRLKPYGETKTLSGKQIGTAITATGVAIPVAVPLPIAAGVGAITAKKVDNIKVIKTDERDRRYKIPRLQFNFK